MKRHTQIQNLSAWYVLTWGAFVASPLDTFGHFPDLYAPMRELAAGELFWGLFFTALGLLATGFIYLDYRRAASALLGAIFTAFAVLLMLGDHTSPSWVLFALIAVFNFIHWREQGGDRGRA